MTPERRMALVSGAKSRYKRNTPPKDPVRGERCHNAKMSADRVREIRAAIERRKQIDEERAKLTNAALADRYGIHVRNLEKIARGETWRHV